MEVNQNSYEAPAIRKVGNARQLIQGCTCGGCDCPSKKGKAKQQ